MRRPPDLERCFAGSGRYHPAFFAWPVPHQPVPGTRFGTLHLWRIDLDPGDLALARSRALLSPDERTRADRFVFDEHRRRFTAGRGALRILLGAYLDLPPEALSFELGPKGKPSLPSPAGDALSFNVSNSYERALVVVGTGQALGVDIEHMRPLSHGESIARHHFSPGEMSALMTLPEAQWPLGFFNCWTRKEAFIKVTGEGLSRALDSFEVSLRPGEPARLLRVDDRHAPDLPWHLQDLTPGEGYAGALCAEGDPGPIEGLDFDWAASLSAPAGSG